VAAEVEVMTIKPLIQEEVLVAVTVVLVTAVLVTVTVTAVLAARQLFNAPA
jgi:hypothetical protein